MKAVTFPEVNQELGKNQPQYLPLPVFVDYKEVAAPNPTGGEPLKQIVPWSMTTCFELTIEEQEEIIRTGKIWYKQMLYGNQFHPVLITTKSPFAENAG